MNSSLIAYRERIDTILGQVTTYKLVVIGLLAIAVMALLLMVTGYLPYSPFNFLLSIVLCVGVSLASNWLLGWSFGVKPHTDSAAITGLILALLFTPPETFGASAELAMVVLIAQASKYVLNFRGKHIFNPSAVAIAIASIGGLAYATWWIATPALLPITAIVATLVLYKTQKMTVAAVFLIVAIATIVVHAILNGMFSLQSIGMSLTSWPLVFFAGIMLVEPLTLPPTRRQQVIVAALVGVLTSTPFHYATITMTPALALVIGNAVAFYMSIRQAVKLRFVAKKKQGRDSYEFTFDVPKFRFQPGQYIELSVSHPKPDFRGSRRVFTIIGKPGDEQISIATRFPEHRSTYKSALLTLKAGTILRGLRVAGDFVLPDDEKTPIVCVAGGIGITPFVSFVMNSGNRNITILYAVNSVDDLAFARELERYDVKVVVVTPDDAKLPVSDWEREKGTVTPQLLQKYVTPESHLYISGPPAMVTATKHAAKQMHVTQHIHTDHFSGY